MVKVKVCGITSLLDAEKSLELGADMLGFNFYTSSPRAIAPVKARAIIARLPCESFNIALFVNAARENVTQAIALGEKLADGRQAYSALQFHGDEPPGFCQKFAAKSTLSNNVTSLGADAKGVRLGCEFVRADPFALRSLQRYIDQTQKRGKLLSLG